MAREQRELRAGIEGSRRETLEIRAMMKTRIPIRSGVHASWKHHQRPVSIVRWDRLKELQDAARAQGQAPVRARTPIKMKPTSPGFGVGRGRSPAPAPVAVGIDIKSPHATEQSGEVGQQDPSEKSQVGGDSAGRFHGGSQQWEATGGLGRGRSGSRRRGAQEPQLLGVAGVRNTSDGPVVQGQRRSVTQPHEVIFGRATRE